MGLRGLINDSLPSMRIGLRVTFIYLNKQDDFYLNTNDISLYIQYFPKKLYLRVNFVTPSIGNIKGC